MKTERVFICHAEEQKPFAITVVQRLRQSDLDPWIDQENIFTGDDVLDEIGTGLRTMDLFIFLASREALDSGWVNLELKHAVHAEIKAKRSLVLVVIVDKIPREDLPWFLHNRRVLKVTQDSAGADRIAEETETILNRRAQPQGSTTHPETSTYPEQPTLEALITQVRPGDLNLEIALHVTKRTDSEGHNPLFSGLFQYVFSPDDDLAWRARTLLEEVVQLDTTRLSVGQLRQMAASSDFSIRSTAAAICMDLAQFDPGRVPLELLAQLAKYDEDWYVSAPAMAALKALVHTRPIAQYFLLRWLRSEEAEERNHAAEALLDIAQQEPEAIYGDMLREIATQEEVINIPAIKKCLAIISEQQSYSRYRYTL